MLFMWFYIDFENTPPVRLFSLHAVAEGVLHGRESMEGDAE